MPYKVWAIGEEVLAADFNDYVQEQVIPVFANAAARTAAIAAPNEGQHSYLADVQRVEVWQSGAWRIMGAGARGVLGVKGLSGNAGFNNNFYDISAGGLTVAVGANRRIRIDFVTVFYGVLGALRTVNVRAVNVTAGGTIAQVSGNIGPSTAGDIITVSAFGTFNGPATAGNVTVRCDASCNHTADIGMAAAPSSQMLVITDVGPVTPGPQ